MNDDDDDPGAWGCLRTILLCFAIWALLFGVTYKGVHYGLRCSWERGVEVSP